MLESYTDILDSEEIVSGNLVVRLARTQTEIEAAQALRYKVFYDEMGGIPTSNMRKMQRDFDDFDAYCEHLLVLDNDLPAHTSNVVGTYRFLRRSNMKTLKHFYTESEFDIASIKSNNEEVLELSRSCVNNAYRKRSVMQLLLRGIGAYIALHDIKLLFGCASFFGTNIEEYRLPLSYLYHYHRAQEEDAPRALPEHYVEMNLMPKEEIDVKSAFSSLPALLKGYLRMNGYIGHGAVVDPQFKTIDVCIIVKTDLVSDKYAQRYSASAHQEE